MKAVASRKTFFAILGMPSSGTSIICRFFDSLENGLCISEPMHRIGRQSTKFNFRGLQEIQQPKFDPREFARKYKDAVFSSDYLVGGLKEVSLITPNSVNRWLYVLNNLDLFDLILFVFRDPVRNIDSIMKKRISFGNPSFEDVVASYKYFSDLQRKTPGSVYISYEMFCELKIEYLNMQLGGVFSIDGELELCQETRSNIIAGSNSAYDTDEIVMRNRDISLTREQVNQIKTLLYEDGNRFGNA